MKTEINIQELKQRFNLDYPEIQQIADDELGLVRLVGYLADYPVYRDKKWYLFADTITINLATNKIYRCEPTKSKGQDWVISNDYKVMLWKNGVPVLNPNFKTEHDVEVEVGINEETGDKIFETQTVPLEISLENSPFVLVNAFDFYYGIRHNRELNISMPDLWASAVTGDDMWEYFDTKEKHYELLDVIKTVYAQMNESI